MIPSDIADLFHQLYGAVDSYAIARQARQKLNYYYQGHTYGEVTPAGFLTMLHAAQPQPEEVFYDLGSGTGKAVLLAGMQYRLKKSVGVEIMEELVQSAHKAKAMFLQLFSQRYQATPITSFEFYQQDFQRTDYSDADIMFMNATCLEYELNRPFIEKLVTKTKPQFRLLTTTHQLNHPQFAITPLGELPFSWGNEAVYLHKKK